MNKKGQISNFYNIIALIMIFSIVIFLFLFMTVGMKQIFSDNILEPTINATLAGTTSLIDNNTVSQVNNLKTTYDSNWFNYDLFFIILVLIFISEIFYTASQTSIDNIFTFFGLITIGNMIFLFLLTFIGVIRDWLILNLYTNFFELSSVNTPIIDYFIANINILSFSLFIICIAIATLNWRNIFEKVSRISEDGRTEE